ncbi:hypothetical protein [Flagellimonas lutaonensis]|uniref:Lipoprotein n=1 Tax=Flagellimonas lutaonensis TaxID=516051 RepID=A0A0D5YT33_9FLAO|nr:hypothetical protein [Allomuricauda lutaonensis]AKA35497.1 hypothetical protein VC82_1892 [Allomuricauda lutaonensis]
MKTSKLLFTFFLILLLFQGCDNESISELVVDDNATQTKIRIDLVDVAEIPRIVGDISAVSNKKSVTWSSTSKGDSKLYIDDTRVLAVTDSLGNVTYSFRLFSESFAPTDMYNLIAAKRVSGDDVEPYVIKYSFNSFEDRIAYVSSNERKFVGKMSVYQLVDFFDGYDVASKNGNPTPCPDFKDVDVNSENSSQGNSGSGTSGSGGGRLRGWYCG